MTREAPDRPLPCVSKHALADLARYYCGVLSEGDMLVIEDEAQRDEACFVQGNWTLDPLTKRTAERLLSSA